MEVCYLFFFIFVLFIVDGGFGFWLFWIVCSKMCGIGF